MQAPQSMGGAALAGAAIVGAGAAAGAYAGQANQKTQDGVMAGGLTGALLGGLAVLAFGEVDPEWSKTGTWAGLFALGAVAAVAVNAAVQPGGAFSTAPMLPPNQSTG